MHIIAIVFFMNIPATKKLTCLLFPFSLHLTLIAQSLPNCQFLLLADKTISRRRQRVAFFKIRNPFLLATILFILSSKNSRICWHRNIPCFVLFVNKNHFWFQFFKWHLINHLQLFDLGIMSKLPAEHTIFALHCIFFQFSLQAVKTHIFNWGSVIEFLPSQTLASIFLRWKSYHDDNRTWSHSCARRGDVVCGDKTQ